MREKEEPAPAKAVRIGSWILGIAFILTGLYFWNRRGPTTTIRPPARIKWSAARPKRVAIAPVRR